MSDWNKIKWNQPTSNVNRTRCWFNGMQRRWSKTIIAGSVKHFDFVLSFWRSIFELSAYTWEEIMPESLVNIEKTHSAQINIYFPRMSWKMWKKIEENTELQIYWTEEFSRNAENVLRKTWNWVTFQSNVTEFSHLYSRTVFRPRKRYFRRSNRIAKTFSKTKMFCYRTSVQSSSVMIEFHASCEVFLSID